jgi:hypothetical protein
MQARIKRRLTLALHAWALGSLVRSDQVKHNYSKLEALLCEIEVGYRQN